MRGEVRTGRVLSKLARPPGSEGGQTDYQSLYRGLCRPSSLYESSRSLPLLPWRLARRACTRCTRTQARTMTKARARAARSTRALLATSTDATSTPRTRATAQTRATAPCMPSIGSASLSPSPRAYVRITLRGAIYVSVTNCDSVGNAHKLCEKSFLRALTPLGTAVYFFESSDITAIPLN